MKLGLMEISYPSAKLYFRELSDVKAKKVAEHLETATNFQLILYWHLEREAVNNKTLQPS